MLEREPDQSERNVFLVRGCIAYETADVVRHSAFCYFHKAGLSTLEHLNVCASRDTDYGAEILLAEL